MACIVAEELRRRSLNSNPWVLSKLCGLWAVLSRVCFLCLFGEDRDGSRRPMGDFTEKNAGEAQIA